MENLLCPWDAAQYLIFSENIPPVLYYSHLTAVLACLIVGAFVFFRGKHESTVKLLILLFSIFSLWAFIDIVIWATNKGEVVMFWWAMIILLEVLVYVAAFYLFFVFVRGKYPILKVNAFVFALLAPFVVLLPTKFGLTGLYLNYCEAAEHPFIIFSSYGLEVVAVFGILAVLFRNINTSKIREEKRKNIFFALGIVAFLLAFTSGNIIGSITENWELAQYGLFGMPIFVVLLSYLIVRYKTFNIKLIATQALTVGLALLIGSQYFFITSSIAQTLNAATLLISIIGGIFLVRSVKKEVAQREQIEDLAGRLKGVNSILSHDVKAVLGKNKDMFNALLTGDLNTEEAKPFLTTSFDDTNKLISSIVTILESGHELILNPSSFDLKKATEDVLIPLKKDAEAKGLTIRLEAGEGLTILADKVQLSTHVLTNLIANAINYTPKGEITVQIERKDPATVLFSVHDTGVGITDEDKNNLFKEGGHGKDSRKVNVHSTGYGLFIAKKIVDAHGGRIWAESEGQGKGSTFFVELPVLPPPQIKKV